MTASDDRKEGAATLRRPGSTSRPPAPDDREKSDRHRTLVLVPQALAEVRGEVKGVRNTVTAQGEATRAAVVDGRDDVLRVLAGLEQRHVETRASIEALAGAQAALTGTVERLLVDGEARERRQIEDARRRDESAAERDRQFLAALAEQRAAEAQRAAADARARDDLITAVLVQREQQADNDLRLRELEAQRSAARSTADLDRERLQQQAKEADAARRAARWSAFWSSPLGQALKVVLLALAATVAALVGAWASGCV